MDIEAKYLNIRWKNKNEIEEVKENFLSEKLEHIDDNTYFLQLYTYTKIDDLYAQIAFHVDEEDIIPAILLSDGAKEELRRVIDPATNKIWWVEKGKWVENKEYKTKYYHTKLFNHIGDTKIFFGDILVDINVKNISLNQEDVGIILDDFKNELWKLIYSKNSYSNMNIKTDSIFTIDENYVKLLKEYIKQINKFLLNPKSRLDEVFLKENLKKVKPSQKTFVEYINNPSDKYYTSRTKQANYNIAENQYVYYTFNFIDYLLTYNIKYQRYLYNSSKNRINNIKENISKLSNVLTTKELEVNKKLFLKDLENKKNIYKKIINITSKENKNSNSKKYHFRIIKIETFMNKYYDEEDGCIYENKELYYHAKLIDGDDNIIYRLSNDDFDEIFTNDCLGMFNIECVLTKIPNIYSFYNYYVPKQNEHKIMHYRTDEYINFTVQDDKDRLFQNIDILIKEKKESSKYYSKYHFIFYDQLNSEYLNINNFNTDYCMIYIPNDNIELIKVIEKSIITNKRLKISIYRSKIRKSYAYKLDSISNIEPVTLKEKIKKLEEKRIIYEANNWIRKFNPKINKQDYNTLQYLEQQKKYSNLNFIMENKRVQSYISTDILLKLHKQLLILREKLKKLNIYPSSYFPNSMIFIQNPIYSKIYTLFNQLLKIQNLDNDTLKLIETTEKNITIVDLPHIYEKWCLIVILNTFIYSFKFEPTSADWLQKLTNSLFDNRSINIDIKLTNKNLGYDVIIWYEKELSSKKIPDIVLDIKHTQLYKTYRIVIDAKFHEDTKIKKLIKLLYHEKNYSENGQNTVFIFHPDDHAMEKEEIIINQQVWGKGSFFGEGILYDEDNFFNYANHQYGAICITPKNFDYLFMVQRFIGMCLQYYTYSNLNVKPNSWICIGCGHANSNENSSCEKCKNYVVYSYCYNCGSKIIKNGHFWSYHKYVVDDPYNIDCPNCGHNLLDYLAMKN